MYYTGPGTKVPGCGGGRGGEVASKEKKNIQAVKISLKRKR